MRAKMKMKIQVNRNVGDPEEWNREGGARVFCWRAGNKVYGSRKSGRGGSADMHGTPPRHRRIICEDRYPGGGFPAESAARTSGSAHGPPRPASHCMARSCSGPGGVLGSKDCPHRPVHCLGTHKIKYKVHAGPHVTKNEAQSLKHSR